MPLRRHPKKTTYIVITTTGEEAPFDKFSQARTFRDVLVRDWRAGAGHSVRPGFIWTTLLHNKQVAMKVRIRKIVK